MKRILNRSSFFVFSFFLVAIFNPALRANPPKRIVKLGFIALTDCAPLVVAKELGLFAKYGVEVQVTKEASWAVIRDKILNGELDGAHCLFSMPFSVYMGIGGKAGSEMRIAMLYHPYVFTWNNDASYSTRQP